MKEKIAQYRQKVASLLAELEKLPDEILRRKPANGGWSATQTILHLIVSEELSLTYVRKKMSYGGDFENAGLGTRLRYGLLWLSLVLPIKFRAPKIVSSEEALPNDTPLSELRARWQKVHDAWAEFFHTLPTELKRKAVYKHPRAGRLGWREMVGFFNVHFDRHLLQIRRAYQS